MKRFTCITLSCAVALQLSACATQEDGSTSRAGQGAVAGAILGGVLGRLAGGDSRSMFAGALAGAAVGAIVGDYQDKQVASRAEAARRYALSSEPRLEVEGRVSAPGRAAPGTAVETQVGYTVLTPASPQDVKVSESRTLVRGTETFPLSKRDVTRAQGTHVSTFKFTLPKDLPAGDYMLVTTVASGTLTRTVQTPLSVG